MVASRELRWAWCWGELVVRIVVEGSARRKIWIAAVPTPELPPRTRMVFGREPVVAPPGT